MANGESKPDLGALYGAARQRITALVTADGVDAETVVPATPVWRLHDVVAHLSGVTADAMTGNMAGAPGEEWTAAQVARGRDRTLRELLAEWAKFGPMLEGFLSSPDGVPAAAAVIDVHTHEADLRHALGLPMVVPADFLSWAVDRLRDGFHDAVAKAGLPPVSLIASDTEWFRARLGRRTVAEVSGYDWSLDPMPYLDAFFVFGRAAESLGEHS